jgi:hypothetical protein
MRKVSEKRGAYQKLQKSVTLAVKETEEVLNFAGKIWTRGGAKGKYVLGGYRLKSAKTGFRQYRTPTLKKKGELKGKVAANFEQNWVSGNDWQSNVHVILETSGR